MLKLAENAIRLQGQHVKEVSRRNGILLFMSGPKGTNYDMAKKYFRLRQEEALSELEKEVSTEAGEKSTLLVLIDVASNEEQL